MATMNYRKILNRGFYDRVVRDVTEEFRAYVEDVDFEEGGDWEEYKDGALQYLYNADYDQRLLEDYDYLVFFLCVVKEHKVEFDLDVEWDKPQKIVNLGYYLIAQEIFGDFKKEEFVG
jgi:hypothetical protein